MRATLGGEKLKETQLIETRRTKKSTTVQQKRKHDWEGKIVRGTATFTIMMVIIAIVIFIAMFGFLQK